MQVLRIQRTAAQKGPPHARIYSAFVKAIAQELPSSHPCRMQCYKHLQSFTSDVHLASVICLFVVREQRRTDKATVFVHFTAAASVFWDLLFSEIRLRNGFEVYVGAPPKGPLVRALQDALRAVP